MPHIHTHHHLPNHHALWNFLGYVAYAILVLGISLVIAALAFDERPQILNDQRSASAQQQP